MDFAIFHNQFWRERMERQGDCHKLIVTLGFSFARIRDTSGLS
jgi:hypothetical protein